MSERAWYVGLTCRRCGGRVNADTAAGGLFVQPVKGRKLGEPWAKHGACLVASRRGGAARDYEAAPPRGFHPAARGGKAAAANIASASHEEKILEGAS